MTSIAEQTGRLDATDLGDLVKKGEISIAELVDGAIERLEKVNGQLNAVITPMYTEARAAAIDQPLGGPFPGVPFLIKDFLAEGGSVLGAFQAYAAAVRDGSFPAPEHGY